MTRWIGAGVLAGLLSACGADGPPVPPEPERRVVPIQSGGVTLSGSAFLGASG